MRHVPHPVPLWVRPCTGRFTCGPSSARPKTVHSEPYGNALAVFLLASVSSLDHLGGARTLGYQKKKRVNIITT